MRKFLQVVLGIALVVMTICGMLLEHLDKIEAQTYGYQPSSS